ASLTAKDRARPVLCRLSLGAVAALAGLVVVPSALALFFFAQGSLAPFFYGTVQHNLLPGLGRWQHPRQSLLFPTMLPGLWCVARDRSLWRDRTRNATDLLAEVLQLTQSTDPVVDVKGETVFRPRSSYYVLEDITRARISQGLLADDIPERLVATCTCVAAAD